MTFDVLIVGQGLAGTALAWQLLWRGARVCVLDREAAVTSSRVAAGLVTPITGQRLAKSWRLDDLWPTAVAFYERAETETGTRFFHRRRAVRLFRDAGERSRFLGRRAFFSSWVADPDPPMNPDWFTAPHGAFAMPAAAHLATECYLDASRDFFVKRDAYRAADVDLALDLDMTAGCVALPRFGLCAERVVFCQGHDPTTNPWFRDVRFGGAKGEILTLRIPGLAEERVFSRGVWLLALGDGLFRAGSTFDHDVLDCVPTERGREEICARLREFLRIPFEVVAHEAAVRPVIDAGKPALALRDRVGFFNGLGSKGALLAPYFAGQLASALLGEGEIEPAVRLGNGASPTPEGSLTARSHAAVRSVLQPGEVAIDATAGNGRDTLFLTDLVGSIGIVFAFEIQADAISRLRTSMPGNVVLLHRDHAELADAIPEVHRGRIGAAMFNLGYRPGGDRTITTHAESTVPAIRAALDWLRLGGVLTVVAYTGHPGGADEAAAADRLLRELPAPFEVETTESQRGKSPGPRLFVVRKRAQ